MNDQASTESVTVVPAITFSTFSTRERRALCALRARYQQNRDLFNRRELAYLRFLRWLYRTGQLVP
ncbi:MAG TPA: hypothetical protein VJY65_07740 [Chloroflexota bacterium]|jgi:hypothetical protein|nr:hypothetical protein [Chloroflexota bacterium]